MFASVEWRIVMLQCTKYSPIEPEYKSEGHGGANGAINSTAGQAPCASIAPRRLSSA
ncbi:MAG: hypothetical protein KGL51_01750 [Betaproteobacteria bacterium]|nr:hypothetical protein [Betaproteobacteria bacterium]MDE2124869.1 hypothetical protein [Betaproteobacteria bacterium]MDE2186503.1 hypothetical protein [Betaproteobacteria bacterium]MDE2323384.1 hypothetical protein [Betaproteobacteria bacterium]